MLKASVASANALRSVVINANVTKFANARVLSQGAGKYGAGLKEHTGDYLRDSILLEHPVEDVTAMNVAAENNSNLREIMTEYAVKSERWRKWMIGKDVAVSVDDLLADSEKSALIADICGHYTYEIPEVKAAMHKMCANLSALGIDAEGYVIKKIKDSIDRYAYCFGMYGLTSRLLEAAKQIY